MTLDSGLLFGPPCTYACWAISELTVTSFYIETVNSSETYLVNVVPFIRC